MNFCPKCGKKLEETSHFCPNCGFNIDSRESVENNANVVLENPRPIVPLTKPHMLSVIGLILGGIAFVVMLILGIYIAINYDKRVGPGAGILIVMSTMIFFVFGVASLGLAIPGFIITKKRMGPKLVAVIALIIGILNSITIFAFMVWAELN